MLKLKRVYRFTIVHMIGLIGGLGIMLSTLSLYFSANSDFLVPMVFFGIVTWFYFEVIAPNNKNN